MIREIQAKTLLATNRRPHEWFGVRYNMNIYRGCEHRCIYCDSRSECYQIEDFDGEVLVKANAIELLEQELSRKRIRGIVGTGSMSDPYTYAEKRYHLTGQALQVLARLRYPVHINTKSDLILRDIEILKEINRLGIGGPTSIAFTITAAEDSLSRQVEPGAPPSSARFAALQELATAGILVGVLLMPVLPFLEDTPENVLAIARHTAECGGKFIIPWFGMTLRDRQREYYYQQLDQRFPGLRAEYERRYPQSYRVDSPAGRKLYPPFRSECERLGLATDMRLFAPPEAPRQMQLFP